MSDVLSSDLSLPETPEAQQRRWWGKTRDYLADLTNAVTEAARSGARSVRDKAHIEVLRNLQEALLFGEPIPVVQPIDYDMIHKPEVYGELLKGFHEEKVTSQFRPGKLAIWHKEAGDKTKPVYVVFHGRRGHWCDVGHHRRDDVGKVYDRRYRARWLKALGDSGAEVIAVHLSGQGASRKYGGRRGERSFSRDVELLADYLEEKHIDPSRLVVAGESLGGAVGIMLAVEMTQRRKPPAGIYLINSFTSMVDCVCRLFDHLPSQKLKEILKHKFTSRERLQALDPERTALGLWHAPGDLAVPYEHRAVLHGVASGRNMYVREYDLVGDYMNDHVGATHTSWSAVPVTTAMNNLFCEHQQSLSATSRIGGSGQVATAGVGL